MKNSLIALVIALSVKGTAQSFHRGALVLDLNTGVEAFHTSQKYNFTGQTADTLINSEAANKNASLGLELGLSKRIGIGVRGKVNSFFPDLDAVTRQRARINSTDLLIALNIHPIVRKHFDLVLGVDLGLSDIDFQFHDLRSTILSSRGHYFAPYICPRVYWGRLGLHLRSTFPAMQYNNFKGNSETPGSVYLSGWKATGFGFSLGVQLRLF